VVLKPTGKKQFRRPRFGGRITLKWILKMSDWRFKTAVIWLRMTSTWILYA
jgi:hypothetical protein